MGLRFMRKTDSKGIFLFGIIFLCLEIFKQGYLYFIVFDGDYDFWYLPFQLCSMPIYICLIYGIINWGKEISSFRKGPLPGAFLMTFIQDYGLLGGILALIVRDGFVFPDHIVLTVHGYIWHIGMIILSLYIFFSHLSDNSFKGFMKGTLLYGFLAIVALFINIKFQYLGDIDMFYISPFHASSQPIFDSVDSMVGRPIGIAIYIAATMIGAATAHLIYWLTSKFME